MYFRFLAVVCALGMLASAHAQRARTSALALRPEAIQAINTDVKRAQYKGRTAVQLLPLSSHEQSDEDMLAILTGTSFKDGTIELEVAGAPRADAKPDMRGFIGIAFRVEGNGEKYESFYIRPTNARSDDQLRRNHSLQYDSKPDYGWKRLRDEHPGVYESYTDLAAGEWTKLKIVVNGARARLYVNDASQPALIVNDLKLGISEGAIALWSHTSTEGYFANLKVEHEKN